MDPACYRLIHYIFQSPKRATGMAFAFRPIGTSNVLSSLLCFGSVPGSQLVLEIYLLPAGLCHQGFQGSNVDLVMLPLLRKTHPTP